RRSRRPPRPRTCRWRRAWSRRRPPAPPPGSGRAHRPACRSTRRGRTGRSPRGRRCRACCRWRYGSVAGWWRTCSGTPCYRTCCPSTRASLPAGTAAPARSGRLAGTAGRQRSTGWRRPWRLQALAELRQILVAGFLLLALVVETLGLGQLVLLHGVAAQGRELRRPCRRRDAQALDRGAVRERALGGIEQVVGQARVGVLQAVDVLRQALHQAFRDGGLFLGELLLHFAQLGLQLRQAGSLQVVDHGEQVTLGLLGGVIHLGFL